MGIIIGNTSGNVMFDGDWRMANCNDCEGMGRIPMKREDFKNLIYVHAWGKCAFELIDLWHDYRRHGETIVCPSCEGEGKVKKWK